MKLVGSPLYNAPKPTRNAAYSATTPVAPPSNPAKVTTNRTPGASATPLPRAIPATLSRGRHFVLGATPASQKKKPLTETARCGGQTGLPLSSQSGRARLQPSPPRHPRPPAGALCCCRRELLRAAALTPATAPAIRRRVPTPPPPLYRPRSPPLAAGRWRQRKRPQAGFPAPPPRRPSPARTAPCAVSARFWLVRGPTGWYPLPLRPSLIPPRDWAPLCV